MDARWCSGEESEGSANELKAALVVACPQHSFILASLVVQVDTAEDGSDS